MTGKMFKSLDMQGNSITGLADASASNGAATWGQVQSFVRGNSWKTAVRAATTANGALATAYENGDSIDGVTLATGDRILLKNQTTQTENGIYTVNASGAPTRALDLATGADARNASVFVMEGTTNADKQYVQTADTAIVGTNNLTWALFGGGTTYTAGNGLSESPAGTFNVDPGTASATGLEINSDQVRIAAAAAGNGLTGGGGSALAVGAGTGISVAADAVAVDTAVVARWFDNGATHSAGGSLTLTHNLGKKSYIVGVCIDSTGEDITAGVDITRSTNSVQVDFSASQGANTIRITVVG